ncbi:MAG: glycosyltransferase [Butyrivibrio sp.]|uniref:glycosyltransferase family 2 protein n=1 Tax=Butyrivibrio sp. TaxID=28121 RepID=UPI001B4E96BC|nr:glycosyltransferase [Butyrivibrio sp.]MBP3784207.1 glycosyltransferase [Butyrivibrio sp.]
MQRLISVIIPCYNVEKWIEQCLLSVEKQTIGFDNIEVVLIDDASTDSTLSLLKSFSEKHSDNTKLIAFSENKGISNVRNAGMDSAEGIYLFFLDADDWIDPSTFEKMYNKATETGLDMIMGGFRSVTDGTKATLVRMGEDWKRDFSKKEDVRWFLPRMPHVTVWATLYKREALFRHDLRFIENCTISEDVVFSGIAPLFLNGCYYINEGLYYYRTHSGTLSHDEIYNPEKNRLIVWAFEEMYSELKKRGIYESTMRDYYHEMAWYMIGACFFHVMDGIYNEIDYFKNSVLKYFPDITDNRYLQILDDKHREYMHFFNLRTTSKYNYSDVKEKLVKTPDDHELYAQLGECLYDVNIKQSYLCFEHAYELCHDQKRRQELLLILHQIARKHGNVPKTTIVILNHNLKEVTKDCLESIRATTDVISRNIVIVDNGSTDGSVDFFDAQPDVKLVASKENLGFPGGCNRGIEASEESEDILLLNNDTVLCDHSLFWLRMGLYEKETNGIVGAVSNHVLVQQQVCENYKDLDYYKKIARERNLPNEKALQYCFIVSGFAMLIKRKTISEIGLLNEDYSPGYYEDCDICLRAIIKGWQVAIVHNSFIIHWGGQSFTYASLNYDNLLAKNKKYLDDSFAINGDEYTVPDHILDGLNSLKELKRNAKILVINCGNALSLLTYKWQHPEMTLAGVDTLGQAAMYACKQEMIDFSVYCDINNLLIKEEKYDVVVLHLRNDDLKGLSDYWNGIIRYLDDSGTLMVIGDNCCHYSNWLIDYREGKKPKYPNGGFHTINDADGFLNAHGYNVCSWITIFGLPTKEQVKEEVKQAADVIGLGWDKANAKAYVIKSMKKN